MGACARAIRSKHNIMSSMCLWSNIYKIYITGNNVFLPGSSCQTEILHFIKYTIIYYIHVLYLYYYDLKLLFFIDNYPCLLLFLVTAENCYHLHFHMTNIPILDSFMGSACYVGLCALHIHVNIHVHMYMVSISLC